MPVSSHNLRTIYAYEINVCHDQYGTALVLTMPPNEPFALALDQDVIERFRRNLDEAEELLHGKSGRA